MVTIIMLISRAQYLKRIFTRLEMLECDKDQTNLITYVDGDLQLFTRARDFTQNSKFRERLCIYRKKGNPNVGSVTRRRLRIAELHNELKAELGPSDYFFIIEDDTLFPYHALKTLMNTASGRRDIGIVSGVEVGRWGYRHIGAWEADDVYDTTKLTSIPKQEGVQPVDATGMYCCLIRSDHYFKHTFKPFDTVAGPDVNFGLWLRQQGYKNYVDFSVACTHLTIKEDLRLSPGVIDIVTLQKEGKKWLQSGERQEL